MSQMTLRRAFSHIGPLQIAIILLAVVTAIVHLQRGLMMGSFAGHPSGPPPAGHFPGGQGGPPAGRPGGPGGSSILSLLPVPLPILFYLNFVAYLGLVIALYLPLLRRYQRIIRWLLIALAAITIIAWFLITNAAPNPLGYVDKFIEAALIILLVIEDRRSRFARG